jgi:hypothetical protein
MLPFFLRKVNDIQRKQMAWDSHPDFPSTATNPPPCRRPALKILSRQINILTARPAPISIMPGGPGIYRSIIRNVLISAQATVTV